MCHICWLDKIYSRVVWVSLYVKIKVSCLGKRVGENLCRGLHGRKGNLVNLYHLFYTFLMQKVFFYIYIGIGNDDFKYFFRKAFTQAATFQWYVPHVKFPKQQLPKSVVIVAAPAPLHSTVFQIAFNVQLGSLCWGNCTFGKSPFEVGLCESI